MIFFHDETSKPKFFSLSWWDKHNTYFNNTFAKAMKKQLDQGHRAQFSMLIKAMNLDLPIDIQAKRFESDIIWLRSLGIKKSNMLEIFYSTMDHEWVMGLVHIEQWTQY